MKIADNMNNIMITKLQEVIECFNTVLLYIIHSQCNEPSLGSFKSKVIRILRHWNALNVHIA